MLSASESSELDLSESMAATAAFSVDMSDSSLMRFVDAPRFSCFCAVIAIVVFLVIATGSGGGGGASERSSEGDRETVRETASTGAV